MENDALSGVIEIVADIFERNPQELGANTRIMVDLPCESIDLLELGASLNRDFKINIDDDVAFLRSLRVHAERFRNSGVEAGLATEYPHLSPRRIQELAKALETPGAAPLLTIGDVAAYVNHAKGRPQDGM